MAFSISENKPVLLWSDDGLMVDNNLIEYDQMIEAVFSNKKYTCGDVSMDFSYPTTIKVGAKITEMEYDDVVDWIKSVVVCFNTGHLSPYFMKTVGSLSSRSLCSSLFQGITIPRKASVCQAYNYAKARYFDDWDAVDVVMHEKTKLDFADISGYESAEWDALAEMKTVLDHSDITKESGKLYIYANNDNFWGCGYPPSNVMSLMPFKWTGYNNYPDLLQITTLGGSGK